MALMSSHGAGDGGRERGGNGGGAREGDGEGDRNGDVVCETVKRRECV